MAGRILSKENEKKLRAALESLGAVLSLLDRESDSDEAKEALRKLQEAANLGNWLESRIHLAFTQIADDMFGDGRLTREERIALSSGIGDALTAFNAVIAETVPDIYQRLPWRQADEPASMNEAALAAEFVPLVERAVRGDGTIPLKIIQPGWGSSGYYPAEVLQRDGAVVFPAKTKMYWNHPTPHEESARPEGDLNALAAELVSDARWDANGAKGPGLYADAKVFGGYKEAIDDMAAHIGVSIRATGQATQGEAEGRKGPIIQRLTAAKSVDFVTEPGAGGQIISMFEAARPQRSTSQQEERQVNEQQFQEAIGKIEQENARLREALILRDAKEFARQAVGASSLPDMARNRLVERLSVNPPIKDGALDASAYAAQVAEAIKAESDYLAQVAGYRSGRVEGMGGQSSGELKPEDVQAKMTEAFQRMGLSEAGAKIAANGRGW